MSTPNNGKPDSKPPPNVPKPSEPTTTQPQNIITEGQKPTSQRGFVTDSEKKK